MKKIGIVGGMGWPSTVHYYELICRESQRHFRARGHGDPLPIPEMVIESVNLPQVRALRPGEGGQKDWAAYEDRLRASFRRVEAAGADFGIMASNTPHQRLPGIRKGLALPIVSIFDTTADTAKGVGADSAVLLGTSRTMRGAGYPEAMRSRAVECAQDHAERLGGAMDALIDGELIAGRYDAARARLVELALELGGDRDGRVVLLACTELPLAFPEHLAEPHFEADGIRWVNTMAAHARAAFARAVQ